MKTALSLLFLICLLACESSPSEKTKTGNEVELEKWLLKGDYLSEVSGKELLKNLNREIMVGSPATALNFCNLRAYPILDSLAKLNQCEMKRISQKFRNPGDKPENEQDLKQLVDFSETHSKGDSLQPAIFQNGNQFVYYRPIVLASGLCLHCHGSKDQIKPETQKVIDEKYPEDLAVGYQLGDFRGAWKITFTNP